MNRYNTFFMHSNSAGGKLTNPGQHLYSYASDQSDGFEELQCTDTIIGLQFLSGQEMSTSELPSGHKFISNLIIKKESHELQSKSSYMMDNKLEQLKESLERSQIELIQERQKSQILQDENKTIKTRNNELQLIIEHLNKQRTQFLDENKILQSQLEQYRTSTKHYIKSVFYSSSNKDSKLSLLKIMQNKMQDLQKVLLKIGEIDLRITKQEKKDDKKTNKMGECPSRASVSQTQAQQQQYLSSTYLKLQKIQNLLQRQALRIASLKQHCSLLNNQTNKNSQGSSNYLGLGKLISPMFKFCNTKQPPTKPTKKTDK